MMTNIPAEDDGFGLLTAKISAERGFGCASYKEKCLRRRVAVRMRARGVHTFGDYGALLDGDSNEYDRLIDTLTVNVTRFFRNREMWETASRTVVPVLWRTEEPIRAWSAGCSSGEEAFSLAILFHRHAASIGELERIGRFSVLGTDIDRECLENANEARYEERDFVDTAAAVRAQYFHDRSPFSPIDEVRDLARFERRDLLSEPAPPYPFELIICRNVLIYFDRETQEKIFAQFHESLAPNGFLVLGKVETLLGNARGWFSPVDARERIFRKR